MAAPAGATLFARVDPSDAWFRAAVGLGLIAAFVAWSSVIGRPDFPLDDAYITLHNARVLLDGYDPNYGASPLIGATSPVHLALVTGLAGFLGVAWASAVVSWLAISAYAAGICMLGQRCGLTRAELGLLLVAAFGAGHSLHHFLNGLETGLAMAAVVWSAALAAGQRSRVLPVLLGTMPFIRPELMFLSAAAFMRLAWRHRRGNIGEIGRDALIAVASAAPWALWMWTETGALISQTAAVKLAYFAEGKLPWHASFVIASSAGHAVLREVGPIAICVVGLWRGRVGWPGLLFAAAFLCLATATFPQGLHHNFYRYMYVLVPLLPVGAALAIAQAGRAERIWLRCALVAAIAYGMWTAPAVWSRYVDAITHTRTALASVTDWINQNVPKDARVAVHDAGYVAYATDHSLVDIVGLKTPASAMVHAALTASSGGRRRGEAFSQILAQSGATHLVVWRDGDALFAITHGVRSMGWTVEPIRHEGAYRVFRLVPPQ